MTETTEDMIQNMIRVGKKSREYYETHGTRPVIGLIGSPGSGKSTQAKKIAEAISERYAVKYINVGELLRSSKDGKIIETMNSGELVADEVIFDVLTKEFAKSEKHFIILDGFFRRGNETDWLLASQKKLDLDVWSILDIHISEEEAANRLSARGRADDEKEDIKVRLSVYHKERDGVVASLKKYDMKLDEVDGLGSVDEVFDRIGQALSWCCPGYVCGDLTHLIDGKSNKEFYV